MQIYIEIYSACNCFQFISIRSCAKMPTLSTLCFTRKLDSVALFHKAQCKNLFSDTSHITNKAFWSSDLEIIVCDFEFHPN